MPCGVRIFKGIEKFPTSINVIDQSIHNELIDKIKTYEDILGIKDDKLLETTDSLNIRNTLLQYLKYIDSYIISHYLKYIYDFSLENQIKPIMNEMNLYIDLTTVLYYQMYPDDTEIDEDKYELVREKYNLIFNIN